MIICCTCNTAEYDEELSEIESEVDRLTRQVSGYERVGQSTPKYMATGERQSVGFRSIQVSQSHDNQGKELVIKEKLQKWTEYRLILRN